MGNAARDQNYVSTLIGVSNADGSTPVTVYVDPVTHRLLVSASGGSGTVTSVSVVTANGVSGSVATSTTTPAITLTLGAITPTSVNGLTITTTTGTLTVTNGKTVSVSNTLTLAGTDSTTITFQGTDTYVGRATTDTLTNKRITARVQSVSDAATVTPNADSDDCVDITAIAQAFTIANPSGTPTNFQKLIIRIKDNGTARAITFGSGYVAGGVALPTTTVLSKILNLGFIYNTANSLNKWQLVASAQEA